MRIRVETQMPNQKMNHELFCRLLKVLKTAILRSHALLTSFECMAAPTFNTSNNLHFGSVLFTLKSCQLSTRGLTSTEMQKKHLCFIIQ